MLKTARRRVYDSALRRGYSPPQARETSYGSAALLTDNKKSHPAQGMALSSAIQKTARSTSDKTPHGAAPSVSPH